MKRSSASPNASATGTASQLPDSGGSELLPLAVVVSLACSGVVALVVIRRVTAG
jgi:hypothetical protein